MSLARLLPLEGQEKGAARRYQRRVVPDPFLEGGRVAVRRAATGRGSL